MESNKPENFITAVGQDNRIFIKDAATDYRRIGDIAKHGKNCKAIQPATMPNGKPFFIAIHTDVGINEQIAALHNCHYATRGDAIKAVFAAAKNKLNLWRGVPVDNLQQDADGAAYSHEWENELQKYPYEDYDNLAVWAKCERVVCNRENRRIRQNAKRRTATAARKVQQPTEAML